MKTKKHFCLCSKLFSTICLAANTISIQPRFFRKPHCASGRTESMLLDKRLWIMRATTFPKTSKRAIPLQLSHSSRLPFLGIGTIWAFTQSTGTTSESQTATRSSTRWSTKTSGHTFTNSGKIPDSHAAFPFLHCGIATYTHTHTHTHTHTYTHTDWRARYNKGA